VIRFAWLQSRTQLATAYALLAAVTVAALITGVQLAHVYETSVAHCQIGCSQVTANYLSRASFMDKTLDILARVVPALLGLFWGAPLLAREFESGTYRLAWTQSISRRRWLLTRIGVGALATLTLAALFSLVVTWWYADRDRVGANTFDLLDRRDLAPVAYAVFAFAVGVMSGALIRRTVPAMAATLGLFVFARIAVNLWVRPHLLPARHAIVSLARSGPVQLGIGVNNGGSIHLFAKGGAPPNAWTQASDFVTLSGQRVSSSQLSAFLQQHCSGLIAAGRAGAPDGKAAADDPAPRCLDEVAQTFKLAVSYQPASRYWIFQWLEAGIFLMLGAAAIGVTYRWVTRRAH